MLQMICALKANIRKKHKKEGFNFIDFDFVNLNLTFKTC